MTLIGATRDFLTAPMSQTLSSGVSAVETAEERRIYGANLAVDLLGLPQHRFRGPQRQFAPAIDR